MVCCKGQCWRVGEYHLGWKNQEDEERCGGMCPKCGGEEEVPSPIRRWAEETDNLLFTCVFKFEKGGWYGWAIISFFRKITRWMINYCSVSWGWITVHVWKVYLFPCVSLFLLLNGFIYRYVGGSDFRIGRSVPEWGGIYQNVWNYGRVLEGCCSGRRK